MAERSATTKQTVPRDGGFPLLTRRGGGARRYAPPATARTRPRLHHTAQLPPGAGATGVEAWQAPSARPTLGPAGLRRDSLRAAGRSFLGKEFMGMSPEKRASAVKTVRRRRRRASRLAFIARKKRVRRSPVLLRVAFFIFD